MAYLIAPPLPGIADIHAAGMDLELISDFCYTLAATFSYSGSC